MLPDGFGLDKNVIIFGCDNSSSAYTNNRKKDILIQHKVQTQGLDSTTIVVI